MNIDELTSKIEHGTTRLQEIEAERERWKTTKSERDALDSETERLRQEKASLDRQVSALATEVQSGRARTQDRRDADALRGDLEDARSHIRLTEDALAKYKAEREALGNLALAGPETVKREGFILIGSYKVTLLNVGNIQDNMDISIGGSSGQIVRKDLREGKRYALRYDGGLFLVDVIDVIDVERSPEKIDEQATFRVIFLSQEREMLFAL